MSGNVFHPDVMDFTRRFTKIFIDEMDLVTLNKDEIISSYLQFLQEKDFTNKIRGWK